jgi:hypothetical protein
MNERFINYFNKAFSITTETDSKLQWNDKMLSNINKYIRAGNYYMLDMFELVIRKNCFKKYKSPFGWDWINLDGEDIPYNIHIDKLLIEVDSPDIKLITLKKIAKMFPQELKERGILYRAYSESDPRLDLETLEYL